MTEQEAIRIIKEYRGLFPCANNEDESLDEAIKALEEIKQYRTIGTPEECRAAVEKQKAKKPIIKYEQTHDCVTEIEWKCPTCGTNYIELAPCGEWCRYCGTKLDWGEEE